MPVDKNAEQRLRQALEANPEDATLHNDLGNELLALGQTAEALESYETALRVLFALDQEAVRAVGMPSTELLDWQSDEVDE